MTDSNAEFLEKLASIKASYINDALPEQLTTLMECQGQLGQVQDSESATQLITALHAAAHKLAGSSGTFGLTDLSVAARALSDFTGDSGPVNGQNYADYLSEIEAMAEEIKKTASA